MFYYIVHGLKMAALWADFIVLTALMYAMSWLPRFFLRSWYTKCFRYWSKSFVRALDINLKLHQKMLQQLKQKI